MSVSRRGTKRGRDWESDRDEATESEGPPDMGRHKRRRREGTDTEPAAVKALREENEELREEVERLREDRARSREEIERLRARSREEIKRLKLKIAKFEAGCQTPQEKDKEVKLPTEVWAIIAGKINKNDVCSFAFGVQTTPRGAGAGGQGARDETLLEGRWWFKCGLLYGGLVCVLEQEVQCAPHRYCTHQASSLRHGPPGLPPSV